MVEEDGLDAAELVDTSGRRTGLGGRGYGAAMATAALGCGGERGGAEGGGRGAGTEGESGGEWEARSRRRGVAALSSPVAGEGVRRGPAPVPTPVGGTGKGRATRGGGLGRLGLGSAQLGQGPVGGGLLLLFFSLFVLFSFVFSFYLFIFFSVLFHLKVFRHFIKMCFLHNNYQCNFWHGPNIFV